LTRIGDEASEAAAAGGAYENLPGGLPSAGRGEEEGKFSFFALTCPGCAGTFVE